MAWTTSAYPSMLMSLLMFGAPYQSSPRFGRPPCPGRLAFHLSIVDGSQPRTVPRGNDPSSFTEPTTTSGGGNVYLDSEFRANPTRSSN